jgi:hypothetical protein
MNWSPRPEIKIKINVGTHLNAAAHSRVPVRQTVINASLDSDFSCLSMGREFRSDLLAPCQSGSFPWPRFQAPSGSGAPAPRESPARNARVARNQRRPRAVAVSTS